jgi:hypothetical protein
MLNWNDFLVFAARADNSTGVNESNAAVNFETISDFDAPTPNLLFVEAPVFFTLPVPNLVVATTTSSLVCATILPAFAISSVLPRAVPVPDLGVDFPPASLAPRMVVPIIAVVLPRHFTASFSKQSPI